MTAPDERTEPGVRSERMLRAVADRLPVVLWTMGRDGTVVCPGSDAAVLRLKSDSLPQDHAGSEPGSPAVEKLLALKVDCNSHVLAFISLTSWLGFAT